MENKKYYEVDVSVTRKETHRIKVYAENQELAEEKADEMAREDRDMYYEKSEVIESEIIDTKEIQYSEELNEWL